MKAGAPPRPGLLVLSDGDLASHLLRALEAILGPVEGARALSIGLEGNVAAARDAIRSALGELDRGAGVLVMTDMFGGAAANLAFTFVSERVEVLTGVNLAMLVKAAARPGGGTLRQIASEVRDRGLRSIALASECLALPPAGERRP